MPVLWWLFEACVCLSTSRTPRQQQQPPQQHQHHAAATASHINNTPITTTAPPSDTSPSLRPSALPAHPPATERLSPAAIRHPKQQHERPAPVTTTAPACQLNLPPHPNISAAPGAPPPHSQHQHGQHPVTCQPFMSAAAMGPQQPPSP
jgi:hypothetical protein